MLGGNTVWGLIGVQCYVVTFDDAVKTLALKMFFPGNISETVKCRKLIVRWGLYWEVVGVLLVGELSSFFNTLSLLTFSFSEMLLSVCKQHLGILIFILCSLLLYLMMLILFSPGGGVQAFPMLFSLY